MLGVGHLDLESFLNTTSSNLKYSKPITIVCLFTLALAEAFLLRFELYA